MTGYLHPDYAAALAELGAPRRLPRSGGWLLERAVPGTADRDAVGPYPLLACEDWGGLAADLEELGGALVSVTAVADPFGGWDEAALRAAFPALARPYKEHFVVDLSRDPRDFVCAHHRRNARRALERVTVERCGPSPAVLAGWTRLYAGLVRRHRVTGAAAFSPGSLARQLEVPGLTILRATHGGETVGMTLWYTQGERAYYHLGAYDETGYRLRASFALFRTALDHFAGEGVRWLVLGAGAGVHGGGDDGLARFKRGWSTGTRPSWLCGRICDPERYARLASRHGSPSGFFPAYRAPGRPADATAA